MKKLFTILLGSSIILTNVYAQKVTPFHAGDRVAFVGNSITDGGHYHSYIWLYYMTHFPHRRITCFNSGIGGDVIKQIYDRFNSDVLSKKPNVITLTWGMNDSGYFEWYRKDGEDVMKNEMGVSYKYYGLMEKKLEALPNIRKIIILTSPYDENTKFTNKNLFPGKAKALAGIIAFQEAAAKKEGWPIVDFYHPMSAINTERQEKDSLFSLTPNDRIHPDNDGHMIMAYLFLKAQGLADRPVADIDINEKKRNVQRCANCRISKLTGHADSLSFDYLAQSLPYPLDTLPEGWGNHKSQAEALKLVPWTKEFNQEILKVEGLKEGSYQIIIDGETIGHRTADELAGGVNLAEITATPQYQQAVQVMELNEERWDIERRLRMYKWMEYDFLEGKNMLYSDNVAAMDTVNKYAQKNIFVNGNKDNFTKSRFKSLRDAWQKEMNVLVDEIYTINKPKNRHFTIVREN
jgi:lysophospholipase L1-like esterase